MMGMSLALVLAATTMAVQPTPTSAPTAAPPPAEPMTTVQPSVAPSPAPAPAPVPGDPRTARMLEIQGDPALRLEYRRANALMIGGAVTAGLGVATLLLVTLPARSLYRRSLEQVEDARWVTDVERPADRARERERVMWISAAVGGGVAALGGVLAIAGAARRHRLLRTPASTFSLAPAVGGGQVGMSASLRF